MHGVLDGVLARVKGGDQELIDRYEWQLIGVVLQGYSGEGCILGGVFVVHEEQVDYGHAQDDKARGGGGHEQQADAEAKEQGRLEALHVAFPGVGGEGGQDGKRERGGHQATGNWMRVVAARMAVKFAAPSPGVREARCWSKKMRPILTRKLSATGA